MTTDRQLLLETADCLRELLGVLIDLQPPDTQDRIAELQVRLLEAVGKLDADTQAGPV